MAIEGKYKGRGMEKGKCKIPPQANIKKESNYFFYKRKETHENGLRQI